MNLIKKYPYLKVILTSVFVFLLFFFSSFFQLIPIYLFDMDIYHLTSYEELCLTLFSDIIVVMILIFIYHKTLKEDFIKFKKEPYHYIDTGFKYWIIGLIIMVVSNLMIGFFISGATAGNEEAVQELIGSSSFLSIITVGILAPIVEELTFRKAFRDMLPNRWAFILISSFVFGGLHVFLSLTSPLDLFYLIPYCSLGVAFAYMYQKTDNIYTSMLMHLFHNTVFTSISVLGAMILL